MYKQHLLSNMNVRQIKRAPFSNYLISAYYKLVELNYRHTAFASEKSHQGLSFRSYEFVNVLDADQMLNELVEDLERDELFYDIGSNIGTYGLCAATKHESISVIACEPHPHVFDHLTKNVQANSFKSQIETLPVAVSSESGLLEFYIAENRGHSSFDREYLEKTSEPIVDTVEVKVESIDTLANKYGTPDRIKIDVEGHGMQVLEGASRTLSNDRPTLYFETHGNYDEVRDYMAQTNYSEPEEIERFLIYRDNS